jgi:hypothetical protein
LATITNSTTVKLPNTSPSEMAWEHDV